MTFLEAAIEVLRDESEALHFSEIAQRAVKRDLLSHVGRDPETAMKSCLTSAVRGNPDSGVLERAKPGHYMIKEGAELPPAPKITKTTKKKAAKKAVSKKTASKKTASKRAASKKTASKKTASKKSTTKKASKRASAKAVAAEDETEPTVVSGDSSDLASDGESEAGDPNGTSLSFEAPSGSGLEGPTDIALVMANAMSRLVDERPELKDEFEAMQTRGDSASESPATPQDGPTIERRSERGRTREDRGDSEERGSRRRRRRRKRGRKVEWSASSAENKVSASGAILDELAKVLGQAGSKSLHVRQLAEQLANVESLSSDISELERAATAAMLVDISRYGAASRFLARGDARFQMRGSRVSQEAAAAEQALYASVRTLDSVTRDQLGAWLKSLGARALESVARMYLEQERFVLRQATSPARGVARLWVEDPELEGDAKTQVLIVPASTTVERRLWEAESDESPLLLFAMGEIPDGLPERIRSVSLNELVQWMISNGVGVRRVQVDVPALEPTVIESIRGLDA